MIDFVGTLSASKSLMNRALIVESLNPGFKAIGHSESDDVVHMKRAVEALAKKETVFECGHAGTVFRFLAFRVAREKGTFDLFGSKRLFSRPQNEIQKSLAQMGATSQFLETSDGRPFLRIESIGWRPQGDGVFISGQESSQYASGLVLSAWHLPFALGITFNSPLVSADYFLMTVKLCRRLGMAIEGDGREWFIPAQQKTKMPEYAVELDVSSAFSIAALAVAAGQASLVGFPQSSLQPDIVFLEYFKQMMIPFEMKNETLKVSQCESWGGLEANLNRHPDLLPVLSVLCAYAKSPSSLSGLDHLAFKESNRIEKSKELIEKLGAQVQVVNNSEMTITPTKTHAPAFHFDPDQDHRMAMAAAVARARGAQIEISNKSVVNKSFPEFWTIAEGSPL